MNVFEMTDAELTDYASPVLSELIESGNKKDWERFSCHFHSRGKSQEAKEDVEGQWERKSGLTSFKQKVEFIGAIRKTDHVATLWKMWNEQTPDEILGVLAFEHEDNDIKVHTYRVF